MNKTSLIVGDGDLSFSANLVTQTPPWLNYLVASCLETQDQLVSKYSQAANNIDRILKAGWRVEFEVDATNLSKRFPNEKFHLIIFNFPHIGGKSNIKKNRGLLQLFFESARDVLAPIRAHDAVEDVLPCRPSIWVTLCRGQGGTPSEKVSRVSGDTWQVVEVAARANFVLETVEDFKAEDYPNYRPTGFRSQEKAFDPVGALRHVFVAAEDPFIPPLNTDTTAVMTIDGESYKAIRHLYTFSKKSNISIINSASEWFHRECFRNIGVDMPSFVLHQMPFKSLYLVSDVPPDLLPLSYTVIPLSSTEASGQDNEELLLCSSPSSSLSSYLLCSSIFLQLPSLINLFHSSDQLIWCEGDVFHRRPLFYPCQSPSYSIVERFLLFVSHPSTGQYIAQIVYKQLSAMCSNLESFNVKRNENECIDTTDYYFFVMSNLDIRQITNHCLMPDKTVIWQEYFCQTRQKEPQQLYVGVFNIDRLAGAYSTKLSCPSSHLRLLRSLKSPKPLFPQVFEHDLSFWLLQSPTSLDVTRQLTDIVEALSSGCCLGVTLLDTYSEPVGDGSSSRTSLCYRLTFSGLVTPLSSLASNKLQSSIRIAVKRIMSVELR